MEQQEPKYTIQEARAQAKYNSAVQQSIRSNELLASAHRFYLNGEDSEYRETLNRLWIELVTNTIKSEREKKAKMIKSINAAYKIKVNPKGYNLDFYPNPKHKREVARNMKDKKAKIFKELVNYEIFLRTVMESQGKLGATKEDDEAFD